MADSSAPSAVDILSVRSRVSWGAIFAGAMIAMAVYFVFTLAGVATGIEVAYRGPTPRFGAGAAIFSIASLLISMFFGGWATSRLAVGETKLEAVLYGVILWGVLFAGIIWLLGNGVRVGFGAVIGAASGAYGTEEGGIDVDRIAADLKRAGVNPAEVDKYSSYARKVQSDPGSSIDMAKEAAQSPEARRTAEDFGQGVRKASWYSLAGVAVSLLAVIFGSLVGSGEVLSPVPILGVKRQVRTPRA